MRRLFYRGVLAPEIKIVGGDAHHLMHVLRARPGQEITVVDDRGKVAKMSCAAFDAQTVTLKLIAETAADTESPAEIILVQCLLKGDKLDYLLPKAVELGAVSFIPLNSTNSVVKYLGDKAGQKEQRWQKIADEAAKQCGRSKRMTVAPLTQLTDFLMAYHRETAEKMLLFCYENETGCSLGAGLAHYDRKLRPKVYLLIGPEGGFTPAESEAIESAGGLSVTLGPRILRAETAALAALSIAQHICGDLGQGVHDKELVV